MAIPVVVLTSDKYMWAMRPFSYLFNIYWSTYQKVIVGCFTKPDFEVPANFEYRVLDPSFRPANRWSNSLIQLLSSIDNELVVFMLEDYWLCRTVDHQGIGTLGEYMYIHRNVLRCDLTTDRLYAGGMFDVDFWGHYDIIETPPKTPYQFSTQAGIWSRELLLSLLRPDVTPWDTEIGTSPPDTMRVIGTRQSPVRYVNAMLKGKLDWDQIKMIPEEHQPIVRSTIKE